MAAVTVRVRGGKGVVVADVAISASHHFTRGLKLMRTRQCPTRRAVIKDRRVPRNGVMAR